MPPVRLILAALSAAICVLGQGTDLGTIRGTVTDASGASIPTASVVVTDVATGISRELRTNEEGVYEATALKSGEYKIRISASGFNTLELSGVVLRPAETARADARLQVQSARETVVVQAEAPLVQTDNPTIQGTLSNYTMVNIPRDSRDFQSFLYLNPNVTQSGASDSGAFKFLGAQSYGASFSLDGQRSTGAGFGQPTSAQPSLETIGELTILSNNFTAEYAGIANVRVITKRGSNSYHGSLFYNNRNSALAAWTLTDKINLANFTPSPARPNYPDPYFNLNEFGGSFGGPVPKLKNTFFYLAYERRMLNSPVYIRSTTLPHPTLWTGDFSRLTDSAKPLVGALSLTPEEVLQYTVNGSGERFIRIPDRLMSPYPRALIQNYFPTASTDAPINATNGRLVDFATSQPGRTRRHLGTIRIDHDFSDRDRIYGVYNGQANDSLSSFVVAPFEGLGMTMNERTNDTLAISETHLFSSTVINEVRGGFNRQPTFRRSNQTLREFLQQIGFNEGDIAAYGEVVTPLALDTYGHPAINFGTGFQNFTNGGRNTYRPTDQNLFTLGDTLSWITGRHTIKAGIDLVHNYVYDGFTSGRGSPRGVINYTGRGIDAWARFLTGQAANSVTFVNEFRPPMEVTNWEQGYFIQDDFKISPRLTLNLGLRYEIITPFVESNDLLVNLDTTYVSPTGRKGRFIIPSEKTLQYLNPIWIDYGYATADQVDVGRALVNPDYNNLAPRIGAAFRLTDSTILRGGWGIFYPTSAAQGIRDPLATNSFQVARTKNNVAESPISPWPRVMTGGRLNPLSGQPGGNWVPFDLQQPRIQQYNVTVERELGWKTALRLSYLGSQMKGLISGIDANMIPPSDTPFGTTIGDGVTACDPDEENCALSPADLARRPFPEFGDYIIAFGNNGHGRSHAFQAEVNRRFSGGLHFNASYTLLDQKSSAPDTGNSSLGGTAYNQFRPDSDFGEDAFTSRHRFITYGVVETPYGRGRHYGADIPQWLDYIAGGWDFSWQGFVKSGTPFTPFWYCDNCGGGGAAFPGNIGAGSVDAVGDFSGGWRPTVSGNAQVKSGDRIWNPDAFGPPPTGAGLFDDPGVAVRNLLRGPGTWGLNAGIRKVFALGERARAELGADVNNLFNHPLLSPDNWGIANLGNFTMGVNAKTLQPEIASVTRNADFGRLIASYAQEGIDARRAVRLRLRITF
jgi:hypothetical protein